MQKEVKDPAETRQVLHDRTVAPTYGQYLHCRGGVHGVGMITRSMAHYHGGGTPVAASDGVQRQREGEFNRWTQSMAMKDGTELA